MDILSKTAQTRELVRELEDERPIMLYPGNDFAMVTWKADKDMENEFYPHQIIQALRLSKPAIRRNYRFLPTLEGFFKIDNRLCLQVDSQKYSLRYMLS